MKTRFFLFAAFGAVLATGCSNPTSSAPASVHGKVTYAGKPVTGGSVTIHGPEKSGRYTLQIDAEGNFAGTDLPIGECIVTVETDSLNPAKVGKAKSYGGAGRGDPIQNYNKQMMERMGRSSTETQSKPAGEYVKIPSRYNDPTKSPLRKLLSKGDQKYDVELTD